MSLCVFTLMFHIMHKIQPPKMKPAKISEQINQIATEKMRSKFGYCV